MTTKTPRAVRVVEQAIPPLNVQFASERIYCDQRFALAFSFARVLVRARS